MPGYSKFQDLCTFQKDKVRFPKNSLFPRRDFDIFLPKNKAYLLIFIGNKPELNINLPFQKK